MDLNPKLIRTHWARRTAKPLYFPRLGG